MNPESIGLELASHGFRTTTMMNNSEKNTSSVFYNLYNGYYFLIVFSKLLIETDKKNFLLSIFYKFSLQVVNFICMLLPLKIILLLSPSQEISGILSTIFSSKENLIVSLCLLLLLFLGLAKLITNLILKTLNEKAYCIAKISNQSIRAFRANKIRNKIRTCVSCFSSALLILIFLLCMFIIYRELSLVVLASMMLSMLFLYFTKEKIVTDENDIKNNNTKIDFYAEFIFFSSFSYIVITGLLRPQDVLFFNLVIGILLTRKITGLVSQVGKALISLNNKDDFIEKLLDRNK